MRSFVADGNFKAVHLKQKDDDSDVWLTSGEGFMTNETRYQIHLEKAQESKSVGTITTYYPCFIANIYSRNLHATATEHS